MDIRVGSSMIGVKTDVYPYDDWHDRYQEYYQTGLALYLRSIGLKLERASQTKWVQVLKILRRVRDAQSMQRLVGKQSEAMRESINGLAQRVGAQFAPQASLVGKYLFWPDSPHSVRMCVDSHDSGSITSPALLENCDVYLKTNYWAELTYDHRVVPFFNCNPVVLPHVEKLVAMRRRSLVYDLSFIVRVWGGKRGSDGVEHCMQLLESIAKVRAKKFVVAELVIGDIHEQERRLRSQGIVTTTKRVSLGQLWEVAATSRLNIFRLGNHQCMSWRMTDLFALGACIVLDQLPKTIWPVPLEPGSHFYSLGAATSSEESVSGKNHYARIPDLLEDLLCREREVEAMRREAGEYFDQHLHPFQIGRRLYDIAMNRYAALPRCRPEMMAETMNDFALKN